VNWNRIRSPGHPYGWLQVALADGQRGFVADRYLRSPIDYRVAFEKQDGNWRMTFFLAGD
jgi:SH3-like domain-containing protein